MAATHTIARRKPAIYGKASRKPPCPQFSPSAFDPLPPSLIRPSSQSATAFSKPAVSDSLVLHHHGMHLSQAPKHLSKQKRSLAELPQLPRTRRTVKDADTWDISSSDEEQSSRYQESTRARKRRKRSPPHPAAIAVETKPQHMLFGSDDESSSPIAMSSPSERSPTLLPLNPSTGRTLTPSLAHTSIDAASAEGLEIGEPFAHNVARAREPRNSRMQDGQRSGRAPQSTPEQSTKAAASASSLKVGKTTLPRARSRGMALQTPEEPDHKDGTPSSHTRTPTSARRSVESTTPHQMELWGMLLPHGTQSASPNLRASISPESTNGTSVDHASMAVKHANLLEQGSRLNLTPSRRRRLVDRLQPATRKLQESLRYSYASGMISGSDSGDEDSHSEISASSQLPNVQRPNPSDPDDIVPQVAAQHPRLLGSGLKVTYSSHRSHLANVGLDDTFSLDISVTGDAMPPKDAFLKKGMREKTPILDRAAFQDKMKIDLDGPQSSSLRTIHELRESGENVRQLSEMEALFDDMDGPGLISVGFRRGKLLELATRLREPACCRLLLDQGFDTRLLAMSASRDNDAVAETLLASTILQLVAAPVGVQATSQMDDNRVADLFAATLENDQDLMAVAQCRKANISRRGHCDLKEYVNALLHSNIWRNGIPTKLSSCMIGLQGLEYLVRKRREAGCRTDILPPRIIERLVEELRSPIEGPIIHSSTDRSLVTRLVVSILEACTISGANHEDSQWTETTLAPILAVLPRLNHMSPMDSEETQRLVLRLYLNLTNNNPRLCQEFAKTDVIRSILDIIESHSEILSDPEQKPSSPAALDTLILAFGTLINLVEWSSGVRHIMTWTEKKDDCFLNSLVKLFTARLEIVAEVGAT